MLFGYKYGKKGGNIMLGKQDKKRTTQAQIISVEELVPDNHILRKIDKYIDFNFIYDLV